MSNFQNSLLLFNEDFLYVSQTHWNDTSSYVHIPYLVFAFPKQVLGTLDQEVVRMQPEGYQDILKRPKMSNFQNSLLLFNEDFLYVSQTHWNDTSSYVHIPYLVFAFPKLTLLKIFCMNPKFI
jgi:coproporphyrinogen III oxidase-like Fe-S oxidoreductase